MVLLGVGTMKTGTQVMEMHIAATEHRPTTSCYAFRLWLSHFIYGSRIAYYIGHLIVNGLSLLPKLSCDLGRNGGARC